MCTLFPWLTVSIKNQVNKKDQLISKSKKWLGKLRVGKIRHTLGSWTYYAPKVESKTAKKCVPKIFMSSYPYFCYMFRSSTVYSIQFVSLNSIQFISFAIDSFAYFTVVSGHVRLKCWCNILFLKHNNLTFALQLSWSCLNTLKNHWINCWRMNFFLLFCHLRNKTDHCRAECLRWTMKWWKKCVSLTKTFLSFNQNFLLLNVLILNWPRELWHWNVSAGRIHSTQERNVWKWLVFLTK